jgi:uroporphyrinogen decarboxylase
MTMNKRDALLNLINSSTPPDYVPAAFFLQFDPAHHQGQPAIDKHLEFFRATGMDFVKIQYEQTPTPLPTIRKPEDWASAPLYIDADFEPTLQVVEGLVKAAKAEALVIMTVYSPFMWAGQLAAADVVVTHLKEKPEAVKQGLEILTENVLTLVRACKRAGVDGFYVSTQGGEAFRFKGTDVFQKYIKPTDLAVWAEIKGGPFNILHVCDYNGGYDDLTPFPDYPGQVVSCSLKVGERTMSPKEASKLFGRPFMGGLERKGTIATGSPEAIRRAATEVLAEAPERFILAADCTVPSETPWDHLKAAIDVAHGYRK